MHFDILRNIHTIVLSLLLILTCGCAHTEPSRFYLLTATNNQSRIDNTNTGTMLGIGPVTVAPYLNQPQIVTRVATNEIYRDEFSRWAEPLQKNLSSTIATNLSSLVKQSRVVMYPWKPNTTIKYQITIDITRLDGQLDNMAVLQADWELLDEKGDYIIGRSSEITEEVTSPDYRAFVAAQSHNLETLCRVIAAEIKAP